MAKQKSENETKSNIKPLAGYVLVEPLAPETKTSSGIILPENTQEKPAIGKVVAVGNPLYIDNKEILSPVQVGDKVVYKKWGGDEIKFEGKELKLVGFGDLMAIVEG